MAMRMSAPILQVLNGSLSIINLFMYYFFTFCLVFWQDGTKPLKQPLKFLLMSFVLLMATLQTSILYRMLCTFSYYLWELTLFFYIECSLTTAVWLGVFYYTQIVPPQSTFCRWLKKNIKWTVYSVMTLDKLLFFTDLAVRYVSSSVNSVNGTLESSNTTTTWESLRVCSIVFYFSRVAYVILSSVGMMIAGCATVLYLKRHIKNMMSCRSPFTASVMCQMRVTTACNVQGILNLLFSAWFLLQHLLANVTTFYFDDYAFVTAISVYSFCTAVNFFVGQPIFKKRAVDLCLKVYKFFQLKEDV